MATNKTIKWKNAFLELESELLNMSDRSINKTQLLKLVNDIKNKNSYTPKKTTISSNKSKNKKNSFSKKMQKSFYKKMETVFEFLGLEQ